MPESHEKLQHVTQDTLLSGKVTIHQPKEGYRAGTDAVFLAASIPATKGDVILDAGCGVGSVALCLLKRVPSCEVVGVETVEDYALLAEMNAKVNKAENKFTIQYCDIFHPNRKLKSLRFDHVMCNPPYHEEDGATKSPNRLKRLAKSESLHGLQEWVKVCAKFVKPRGTISFVHRADRFDEIIDYLPKDFGGVVLMPMWSKDGQSAKRVIVRATRGSKAPAEITKGLIVHQADGYYTAEARKILYDVSAFE